MKVTGNNYNSLSDTLFGSSSMNSLTQTVTGVSKGSSMLSDYAMIKNGSYKKLMKSYYEEVGTDGSTTAKASSKSGFSVDDLKKVNKTSYEKKAAGETVEETKVADADGTVIKKDDNTNENKTTTVDQSYNDSGVGVSMGDAMSKLYNQYI